MSSFDTIESVELMSVTGGLEASGEVTTPGGSAKGSVKTDPTAPDPEKQMRCYAQVEKQANWFQSSDKTLRQQLQLCGPLRP
ncbi:MAG TPA: hypothetical protein VFQ65_00265 [Kofleriaceae bacterium]|nr:hypothetical protein [Kofleriaceae bacterium]